MDPYLYIQMFCFVTFTLASLGIHSCGSKPGSRRGSNPTPGQGTERVLALICGGNSPSLYCDGTPWVAPAY